MKAALETCTRDPEILAKIQMYGTVRAMIRVPGPTSSIPEAPPSSSLQGSELQDCDIEAALESIMDEDEMKAKWNREQLRQTMLEILKRKDTMDLAGSAQHAPPGTVSKGMQPQHQQEAPPSNQAQHGDEKTEPSVKPAAPISSHEPPAPKPEHRKGVDPEQEEKTKPSAAAAATTSSNEPLYMPKPVSEVPETSTSSNPGPNPKGKVKVEAEDGSSAASEAGDDRHEEASMLSTLLDIEML